MFVVRQRELFWAGFIAYLSSFFLVAVAGIADGPNAEVGTQSFRGLFCAYFALLYPWIEAKDVLLHNVPPLFGPLPYVSLLISGLINPVFVAVAALRLIELDRHFVSILKIAIVMMIPFSWIFIVYRLHTYPREGNFLWIIGILLFVFSDKIALAKDRKVLLPHRRETRAFRMD